MSNNGGEYAGNIQVLHECNDEEYRLTVSNPEDGSLLFSWAMPVEIALGMAHQMGDTISTHQGAGTYE